MTTNEAAEPGPGAGIDNGIVSDVDARTPSQEVRSSDTPASAGPPITGGGWTLQASIIRETLRRLEQSTLADLQGRTDQAWARERAQELFENRQRFAQNTIGRAPVSACYDLYYYQDAARLPEAPPWVDNLTDSAGWLMGDGRARRSPQIQLAEAVHARLGGTGYHAPTRCWTGPSLMNPALVRLYTGEEAATREEAVPRECPCGATARENDRYCSQDCEPTHRGADTISSYDGTEHRWRPELVTPVADIHLRSIRARTTYESRDWISYYSEIFERPGGAEAGLRCLHLRLDDDHRYVGSDLIVAADADLDAEPQAGQIRRKWAALMKELTDQRLTVDRYRVLARMTQSIIIDPVTLAGPMVIGDSTRPVFDIALDEHDDPHRIGFDSAPIVRYMSNARQSLADMMDTMRSVRPFTSREYAVMPGMVRQRAERERVLQRVRAQREAGAGPRSSPRAPRSIDPGRARNRR